MDAHDPTSGRTAPGDPQPREERPGVGVVLVTHAGYGQSLLDAAGYILGSLTQAAAVGVDSSRGPDETLAELKSAVERCDAGGGVLILTDMFGGTPTNLSLSLLGTGGAAGADAKGKRRGPQKDAAKDGAKGRVEVVTGVNLPMLLKALGARKTPLAELASEAKEAGGKGIVSAGELLRSRINEA